MADLYNLGQASNLSPEQFEQQQQLNRQQQMAQMLMQQSGQPQGQMVSGRYVAPSWAQQLAPMLNVAASQYIGNKADTKAADLAKAIRSQEMSDINKYNEILKGKEAVVAVPEKTTELAGPYTGDIPKPTAYQAPVTGQAAVAPDADKANLFAASSYSPILRQMGVKKLTDGPKWEKSERVVNGVKETGYVDLNSPNPPATFRMSGSSPDIDTAKGVYEGYLPSPNAPQAGNQGGAGNFGSAVNKVLSFEGGYVASDGKSNAPTNFGINQKANPDIDVKNLTKDQAVNVYKTRYWDAIGADKLPSQTAEIAFDAAVNQGVDYAKGLIQKTGGDPAKMLQQRALDYQTIVQKDPTQAKYLSSWMNRLTSLSQGGQSNVSGTDSKYAPANIPQYKEDPTLSPKQNADARAKFNTENQNAMKNAENSFGLLKSAADILNTGAPSSGLAENLVTGAREIFGGGGQTSKADAQLKILGNKLTGQVPRFEGPQSDKDTAIYQAAAGDLQNPNIPIPTRLASIQTMIDLNKKYYPNGDWGNIDISGPVTTRQTFLKGSSTVDPVKFAQGLNEQDKEAFKWVRQNPEDPRAADIKQRLGIK